jgi:hypothetical protein
MFRTMWSSTADLVRHGGVQRRERRDLPSGVDPSTVDAGIWGGR